MKFIAALVALVLSCIPLGVRAESPDLSISASGISFSTSTLYAGDNIRIYASVRNVGDTDVTGYVYFYQGSMPIAKSQAISLRANGAQDEVFVDFTVPYGSFNIRAVIQGTSPQDIDPSNDVAVTPLYQPVVDDDRDGTENDDDNCPDAANADQTDTDNDGDGDACDSDDDNDDVVDADDPAPTDGTVTGEEEEESAPAPVATPRQTETAATTSSENESSSDTSTSTSNADVAPSADGSSSSPDVSASPEEALTSEGPTGDDTERAATTSASRLKISPNARFTYRQIDWRTFEFTIAEQPEDAVQFTWDFGDGASSVQPQILHSFPGNGVYTVTLAIVDEAGNSASDAQTFDISFFHLTNPHLQLLLGVLFILLAALAVVAAKVQQRLKRDV